VLLPRRSLFVNSNNGHRQIRRTTLHPVLVIHITSVALGNFLMKRIQGFFSIAAVGAIALMSQAQSAQAFSFNLTAGAASPSGVTDQGAYSEFAASNSVHTVDFNSGAPTTGFATYSFQSDSGSSNVRSDVWAPSGSKAEVNKSNYLAVFEGNDATIKLASTANYFGINWGAMSAGNTFTFYHGDKMVKSYSTEDVSGFASVHAEQHYGEGNGYAHFYANNSSEIFDRIVVSQVGGGGFETDNHSFRMGTTGFDPKAVPEPGILLGLATIGGSVWSKKRQRG
jgi:hypothetical protein